MCQFRGVFVFWYSVPWARVRLAPSWTKCWLRAWLLVILCLSPPVFKGKISHGDLTASTISISRKTVSCIPKMPHLLKYRVAKWRSSGIFSSKVVPENAYTGIMSQAIISFPTVTCAVPRILSDPPIPSDRPILSYPPVMPDPPIPSDPPIPPDPPHPV